METSLFYVIARIIRLTTAYIWTLTSQSNSSASLLLGKKGEIQKKEGCP